MTEERLKALEGWAGYPDRDPQAARLVRELVREVRRLTSTEDGGFVIPPELIPGCYSLTWQQPGTVMADDAGTELVEKCNRRRNGKPMVVLSAAPVPPFPGILSGITAEDVYGVYT